MLESELQRKCKKYVKENGGAIFKVDPLSNRGYLDTVVVFKNMCFICELKRSKSATVRRLQRKRKRDLTAIGITAIITHDFEQFKLHFDTLTKSLTNHPRPELEINSECLL